MDPITITKEIKREIKKLGKRTFHLGGVHPEANKFAHSAEVYTFPLPDQAQRALPDGHSGDALKREGVSTGDGSVCR